MTLTDIRLQRGGHLGILAPHAAQRTRHIRKRCAHLVHLHMLVAPVAFTF
jgi:hypothetical protein